jgi:hypothetical protein
MNSLGKRMLVKCYKANLPSSSLTTKPYNYLRDRYLHTLPTFRVTVTYSIKVRLATEFCYIDTMRIESHIFREPMDRYFHNLEVILVCIVNGIDRPWIGF